MKNTILKTKNLSKTFSTEGVQQHVLKNLNIEIYQGDFTVIMGASGGGKSTLLYALSGMDTPTLGSIEFSESTGTTDIAKYSQDELSVFRRKNCGFVFQQFYLVDTMSVLDNVLMPGLLVSQDKERVLDASQKLLTSVGLEKKDWHKFPRQLSGGEAQRVGVARAAINNPRILFADEPTGALNSHSAELVLNVLSEVHRHGQSIVMVTHDINSALRGNRILYLRDGIIEGECRLEPYAPNLKERKIMLKAFLEEMGW